MMIIKAFFTLKYSFCRQTLLKMTNNWWQVLTTIFFKKTALDSKFLCLIILIFMYYVEMVQIKR